MDSPNVQYESLSTDKNAPPNSDGAKRIEDLYALIEKIDVAMLTTREADGSLVSRPMATQRAAAGVDLWFMTSSETHKVESLQGDPEVNVMYFSSTTKEWVSVSGTATLSRSPARIRELYRKEWKAWLGDHGTPYDGGPTDPRIVLIDVHAHDANYFKSHVSRPVMLFKVAKAIITGQPPNLGSVQHVSLA
ncbi:MAG: pyridoxamine 5'-phosphate oxidase family protein [Casimicrobiaceae bacterium]